MALTSLPTSPKSRLGGSSPGFRARKRVGALSRFGMGRRATCPLGFMGSARRAGFGRRLPSQSDPKGELRLPLFFCNQVNISGLKGLGQKKEKARVSPGLT